MIQLQTAFSGLSVRDLEAAKHFYTEVLGLELISDAMGLQLRLPGGGELFVYPKDDHQPATFTILNLVVDDIDATVADLTNQGVNFERYENMPGEQDDKGILRGRSANRGPDIAWFTDPSGNILAVLQN